MQPALSTARRHVSTGAIDFVTPPESLMQRNETRPGWWPSLELIYLIEISADVLAYAAPDPTNALALADPGVKFAGP